MLNPICDLENKFPEIRLRCISYALSLCLTCVHRTLALILSDFYQFAKRLMIQIGDTIYLHLYNYNPFRYISTYDWRNREEPHETSINNTSSRTSDFDKRPQREREREKQREGEFLLVRSDEKERASVVPEKSRSRYLSSLERAFSFLRHVRTERRVRRSFSGNRGKMFSLSSEFAGLCRVEKEQG